MHRSNGAATSNQMFDGSTRFNQVIYVAKATSLLAVAVDCKIAIHERLNNKIADYSAVIGTHSRTIGIENPDDLDIDAMLPV
jgi:hypothetical protein